MVHEKVIRVRVSRALLQLIDNRVHGLSLKCQEMDLQYDRSKYIRELIRADMKEEGICSTDVAQTKSKQKTASKPAVWNFPK